MNDEELLKKTGYLMCNGAVRCLAMFAFWFFVIFALLNVARWVTGFGMDTTDKDGYNRSGLKLHVDNLTGVHYLSDGKGGLTVRIRNDGKPFIEQR